MLILLQKCDFDIAQAERRGEEYVAQFSRYGREIVDEKQTLPYDLMWRWIADWTKQHAPKYQKSTPKKPAPAKPEGLPWRQVVT